MKLRERLLLSCAIGTLIIGAGPIVPSALAEGIRGSRAIDPWWFHGTIEVGGRFFLNNPQKDGQASLNLNQRSLAKYYEYSSIKPGAFLNFDLATGSRNGLYQVEAGGRNVGYSDQSYYLDWSQAGTQYLSLGWDQTPHVYSMSAQTPYAVNGNRLTLLPGIPFGLNGVTIVPYTYKTDIGIERDTASAAYRWTPSDAWDFKSEYSHMRRTGTQVASITGLGIGPMQHPRPVADTTQNYDVNGEYAGTSPWGQRITLKLGYFGSQYTDDYAAYTVQNTAAGAPFFAQVSTPPSNHANGFNGTLAADLPWKSRYVGTLSYNMMRQDAAFNPMSSQLSVLPAGTVLPASSLNGKINTLLSNNVLTTKIAPELTSKLSYRYYDFHNDTPELYLQNWIRLDGSAPPAGATEIARHNTRSLSISYTKQNAGADLVWRPSRQWTLGAAYGFERYTWTRADADATNEHSGKVFADWKPAGWLTARSSAFYGNRRYHNYDYLNYVGNFQWPLDPAGTAAVKYPSSYRQHMFSNRETWKANYLLDVVAVRGLTITPSFKYQDEQYGVNPLNQQGLKDRRIYSVGIEGVVTVSPTTSIMAGYVRDYVTQLMFGTNCTSAGSCTPANYQTLTNNKMTIDTAFAVLRHEAIPNRLDTELRYTASRGTDSVNLFLGNGTNPTGCVVSNPMTCQFPDMTTWYQRADATATYKFDKEQVARMGWTGDVKAKLRYTWERNSVGWYASDWFPVGYSTTVFVMGWDNPNYDVHMMAAALAFTW
jgi:MtrB/PioB family decaheme-associated outer membrane protein